MPDIIQQRMPPRRLLAMGILGLAALLLTACSAGVAAPPATAIAFASPSATLPPPTATSTLTGTATPTPTLTHTPSPTATHTHTPTATATATPTETGTPTATLTPTSTATRTSTPTPTPTPLEPLSIDYMRMQTYPGSDVTIEHRLEPGSNYSRFLASYESDGNTIYALLTVPSGGKPASGWPVIIFNHGYIPPAQYRTTERYVAYVDALARSGYIVFKSDYRGHGSSEGEPNSAYGAPDYTVDILNAVAAMQAYPGADPDRVGMWGHSMGGTITLRAMVTTSDVKVGVIWAGVVASYPDLMTRWSRPNRPTPVATYPGRRWRTEFIEKYGSPEENPAFWASIAPITYVDDVSGPIQLHHGTADEDVPVLFSELLYEAMDAADQPVELYTYEGDNHNISTNFSTAMSRTVAFFDRYLK